MKVNPYALKPKSLLENRIFTIIKIILIIPISTLIRGKNNT